MGLLLLVFIYHVEKKNGSILVWVLSFVNITMFADANICKKNDLCRFIFCRAVFSLHLKYQDRLEYMPRCCPALPDEVLPNSKVVESVIFLLATNLGVADQFDFNPTAVTKKADDSSGSFKDETTTMTGEDFSAEGSEEELTVRSGPSL